MFFAIGMTHSNGPGHAAGLVDHVDVDAQEFGHFGVDDAVAGVGAAAGTPDHHGSDIAFGKPFRSHGHAGGNGEQNNQADKQNLSSFLFLPLRMV